MSVLSPSQLEKPYTAKSEFYGLYNDRGEKFLEKIMKNEPFELTDGSFSTISKFSPGVSFLTDKKYNELGSGKKLFIGEGDRLLSLSSFIKTEEFGSSGGQGAGTKNTSIQESTQAVFNSLIYNVKKDKLNELDVTYENISHSYQYCNTTTPLEDIYSFSQNKSWLPSFLTSSNILYSNITSSNYTHHRDSPFINSLYEAYRKTTDPMQSDKWNPSDIWFVGKNVESTLFSASLYDLNHQLKVMYNNNELIGVSLKKIGENPKFEVVNFGPKLNRNIYEGFKLTGKSKCTDILYNDGRIVFRTFNTGTGFCGEILGKTAAHGKIGVKAINKILYGYGVENIPSTKFVKDNIDDSTLIQLFYSAYINFIEYLNKNEFIELIQLKELDWRVSKYLGLMVIQRLENQPKNIQDEIITEILNYASSQSKTSSVFVKIS